MQALDHVHDIQRGYRRLVRALALPGTLIDLSDLARRIRPEPPFHPVMLLLAYTLLDAETTFTVWSVDAERDTRTIAELTYARSVDPAVSGYHFVLGRESDPTPALTGAFEGTLIDPHLGATVFFEVDRLDAELGPDGGSGDLLTLTGPGIDGVRTVAVWARYEWLVTRNERTIEYPLGIDCILVDAHGRALALPRTTRIGTERG